MELEDAFSLVKQAARAGVDFSGEAIHTDKTKSEHDYGVDATLAKSDGVHHTFTEKGVRTWLKPWDAGNTTGRIIRPLRHNGIPYSGINILMLWASAVDNGFINPTWMTFHQALDLDAHVRKCEKGSLVVYANAITKTDAAVDGVESEREILGSDRGG